MSQAVSAAPARHRFALTLRGRLLLLVVASVVPLLALGLVREYRDYQLERDVVYQGLTTMARGVAVSVERDLLLRTAALETLAMSPGLQTDNLEQFDQQATTFLDRQPDSAVLALVGPNGSFVRIYGASTPVQGSLAAHSQTAFQRQVFETGHTVVTDLQVGQLSGKPGFSVIAPVFKDGHVVYALAIQLRPRVMAELVTHLTMPADWVVTIADAAGAVVARLPHPDAYIGHPIVPTLWRAMQAHLDGTIRAPTLEGEAAVAAFTRISPSHWAIIVGAPEQVLAAPLRAAVIRTMQDGALVLIVAMLLAGLAARGITGPIDQLRHMAQRGDAAESAVATGLPETDTVARALAAAAADRRAAAVALAESEQRFRDVFSRSPSGTILVDPDTTQVIDCNEAAAGFVGYTVDEFRQIRLLDLSLQTTPEKARDIAASVRQGHVLRYETRVRGKQGPRDLLVAVAPIRLSGRTLMLLSQLDVTELRAAEIGLRINEERLELARQGANLGIWDWDIQHDRLIWSEHQWHLHGLDPAPGGPTPQAWRDVLDPADVERTHNEIRLAVKQPGYLLATEYTVVLKNESRRRLLTRGQAIRDPHGRAVRLVGINMDVTDRYEAELARDRLIELLETEQRRLAEIIDILPVGVGIVERTGRFILSNPSMRRLTGSVLPSMEVNSPDEWIAHHPDGHRLAPHEFPARRALQGEATLPGTDFLFRPKIGSERWVRVTSIPLRWSNGEVQEALAVSQDIDAERRLVEIQQQTNARLELRVREEVAAREAAQQRAAQAERVQALGQIAGGIAHDFNNVLQAVSGGAALIEGRPDNAERVLRHARMIADAARRGAAITSRLLAFARRGDLRAENLDALSLLTDISDILSHTLGGAVVCQLDVPPGLPLLFADRGQLETVLVNLATNARDAMPSGGALTMSASVEVVGAGAPHPAGLSAGGYIRLCVSDTGTGMDPGVLARVTEPFFTTKEPGKGTGLGLAMAKGFVEQSGGGLAIHSRTGHGTRVSLWLPKAEGSAASRDRTAELRPAAVAAPCVLLVDDDPIVRDVLTASLEDVGYHVLAVDSGPAALSLLGMNERIEILVSDLTMPTMDGVSLIRAAQVLRPGLPAVLLTGYAGDGAALAVGGAISGAFSLLRKPVSGTQLVDRISGLMESRRLRKLPG